jgi:hypothetical protein
MGSRPSSSLSWPPCQSLWPPCHGRQPLVTLFQGCSHSFLCHTIPGDGYANIYLLYSLTSLTTIHRASKVHQSARKVHSNQFFIENLLFLPKVLGMKLNSSVLASSFRISVHSSNPQSFAHFLDIVRFYLKKQFFKIFYKNARKFLSVSINNREVKSYTINQHIHKNICTVTLKIFRKIAPNPRVYVQQ